MGFSGDGVSGDGLDEAETNVSFDDVDAFETVRRCPVASVVLLGTAAALSLISRVDGLGLTAGGGGFFWDMATTPARDSSEATNTRDALLGCGETMILSGSAGLTKRGGVAARGLPFT
jgi:hypothetical protein